MKIEFYSWWTKRFSRAIITFLDVHWNFDPLQWDGTDKQPKRIGFTLFNFEVLIEW